VTSSECFCHLLLQQDADILADRGQTLNANQQQLVLMNGMIFGELGVLIGLTEKFATVRHTHTHTHTLTHSESAHICTHTQLRDNARAAVPHHVCFCAHLLICMAIGISAGERQNAAYRGVPGGS
jgi:hypothetical protein